MARRIWWVVGAAWLLVLAVAVAAQVWSAWPRLAAWALTSSALLALVAAGLALGRMASRRAAGVETAADDRRGVTELKLRAAFDMQAGQVAAMQRQAQMDAVSGLPLRRIFVGQLQERLAEPGGPGATLLLVRVLQLDVINQRQGHDATDRLLGAVADVLMTYVDRVPGSFAGRLNGSDFALCLPVTGVALETAASLRSALAAAPAVRADGAQVVVGGVDGVHDSSAGDALAAADAALARAEEAAATAGSDDSAGVVDLHGRGVPPLGARAWREQIASALNEERAQLAEYPVVDAHGKLLMLECPLRVQLVPGGDFEAAEHWLALARRSRLMPEVDLAALRLALRAVARDQRPRAVHVAAASMSSAAFVLAVDGLLAAAPAAARQMAVETVVNAAPSSGGAALAALAAAAAVWRRRGLRIGVIHAGGSPQDLPALQGLGVDYVMVKAGHLRGVAADPAVRGYAQGLLALIRGLGLQVLAAGVDEDADLRALWTLGFDGVTGPVLARRPDA